MSSNPDDDRVRDDFEEAVTNGFARLQDEGFTLERIIHFDGQTCFDVGSEARFVHTGRNVGFRVYYDIRNLEVWIDVFPLVNGHTPEFLTDQGESGCKHCIDLESYVVCRFGESAPAFPPRRCGSTNDGSSADAERLFKTNPAEVFRRYESIMLEYGGALLNRNRSYASRALAKFWKLTRMRKPDIECLELGPIGRAAKKIFLTKSSKTKGGGTKDARKKAMHQPDSASNESIKNTKRVPKKPRKTS